MPFPPAAQLTAARIAACDELARAAAGWLGPVQPLENDTWFRQRQTELIVRGLQSVQGTVVLARHKLWAQTSAVARMCLEDAAVAHWLVNHPDGAALQSRWAEHLQATRLGDFKAQQDLGLEIDAYAQRWREETDWEAALAAGQRHGDGTRHWTGKSIAAMAESSMKRVCARDAWAERTTALVSVVRAPRHGRQSRPQPFASGEPGSLSAFTCAWGWRSSLLSIWKR